jgi:hypothetical protein
LKLRKLDASRVATVHADIVRGATAYILAVDVGDESHG